MNRYRKRKINVPTNLGLDELTEDQRIAFDTFTHGSSLFITGPGGVGKTYLINKIKKCCEANNIMIGITAMTGCAAYIIQGNTLHSWLGIGLGKSPISAIVKKIRTRPYLRNRWKNVRILVIDEVSMLDMELFDKLDQIARLVRNYHVPWGGIQLCLFGDMCQLPPISGQFVFESENWESTIKHVVQLRETKRQTSPEFSRCLNEMRLGGISAETEQLLKTCSERKHDPDSDIKPTRLYPYNSTVDRINRLELQKLRKAHPELQLITYECETDYKIKNKSGATKKKRESSSEVMDKNSKYSVKLELIVGAQVMLIVNLDVEGGLVNGSRGVVVGFEHGYPRVKFRHGKTQTIDRYTWEREDTHFTLLKSQLPLKLAWACSIHKSQGATLDYAEMDISGVFEYGQAYVAMSRVRSPESLIIKDYNVKKIKCHPKAIKFYRDLD